MKYLKTDSAVIKIILIVSAIFWISQTYDNFIVKGHVEYFGDVWRYELAAKKLTDAWLRPAVIGIDAASNKIGYLSLFSPFAPSGEKPFYIYAVALVKLLLLKMRPEYAESALLLVNGFSILGIAICCYALLKRTSSGIIAALGFVLVLLNFDLYFHAMLGYHTVPGILLFMLGILISGNFQSKQRVFLSGVMHGASLFVSPHVIVPAFFWYAGAVLCGGLPFQPVKRHILFLAGFLAVIAVGLGSHQLNLLYKIPSENAVSMLFWEQTQARFFGAQLPGGFGFFWDYYFYQFGILPGVIFLFFSAAAVVIFFSARRKAGFDSGVAAVFSVALTYVFYNVLKLPVIGRLYSPLIVLIITAGLSGLNALTELNFRHRIKGLENYVFLIASVVFLGVFITHVSSMHTGPTEEEKAAISRILADYPGFQLINSRDIKSADYKNPDFETTLSKAIVKVDPAVKFRHASIFNCEFEILASEAVMRGQKPLITVEKYEPYQSCFMNENYYYAFCKKRWQEVIPEYAYLNALRPGFVYYFDGKKLAGFYKDNSAVLRGVACPQRRSYAPPALPW